ncbi:MAG TPA: hypothetical protein VET90_01620, partial [Candidatus Binatus sp.]|nr:hypothetical protein [Candidatus Binatus sp.]
VGGGLAARDLSRILAGTNKEPWARSGPRLVVSVRAALLPDDHLEEGADLPPSAAPKGAVVSGRWISLLDIR